ncbi:hypothetical protein AGMMS4957_03070 [Bacteroidia bacterium]|nr:hypothetical protein AGMMS4957_03070 [Bacteroidia bacterium]
MLNQSFSAQNFENIFDIENRKGNIKSVHLSHEYLENANSIKECRAILKSYTKRRKRTTSSRLKDLLEKKETEIKIQIEELLVQKKEIRNADLEEISKIINHHNFKFNLTPKDDDKFVIENSKESFFAIKQLQHNIRKTFGVKQGNRHTILSQIKLLLNDSSPKYVIRTDVTHFFESISQEKLLKKVENNTLLNRQSKAFIRQILKEYNNIKDRDEIDPNRGVPRGVGISAYLSELYMKDIDNTICKLPDVIYYARYVDDIFIIISPSLPKKDLNRDYYAIIKNIVSKEDLSLKDVGDDKCTLLDLSVPNVGEKIVTYLGYAIHIGKQGNKTTATFGLSESKKKKIRNRITKSIAYFNNTNKYNINKARKELLLCLRFLCTNTKLSGTKSRVKTGIYYSNDLLDVEHINDISDFNQFLDDRLKICGLSPHDKLFVDNEKKQQYIDYLTDQINKTIDCQRGFNEKTYHTFSINDMKTIKRILQ